jgi:hypothetical protein
MGGRDRRSCRFLPCRGHCSRGPQGDECANSLRPPPALRYTSVTSSSHDVQAENVLLDSDSHAIICDWGMARVKRMAGSTTQSLMSRAVVDSGADMPTGTLRWNAPELQQNPDTGGPPLSTEPLPSSDVWAFATTAWEALTGRIPYADMPVAKGAVTDLLCQRPIFCGKTPADYYSWPPDVPSGVVTLLCRCWAKEAADRPSMRDVAAELRAASAALGACHTPGHRDSSGASATASSVSASATTSFSARRASAVVVQVQPRGVPPSHPSTSAPAPASADSDPVALAEARRREAEARAAAAREFEARESIKAQAAARAEKAALAAEADATIAESRLRLARGHAHSSACNHALAPAGEVWAAAAAAAQNIDGLRAALGPVQQAGFLCCSTHIGGGSTEETARVS